MKPTFSRRAFAAKSLRAITRMAAGASFLSLDCGAVPPMERGGKGTMRLGLAAYSLRDRFKHGSDRRPGQPAPADAIDMLDFIDYCAEHGCDGAEVTSYYFPPEVGEAFLLQVKRRAFLRGVTISGTAIGNTFTHAPGEKRAGQIALTKAWIDRAAILGAPHVRVFAGDSQGQLMDVEQRLCIEALEECGDYAGTKGVFLGLENHGGIVAEAADLLDIVRAVRSPWVGINLDTGNFHTADPYGDLAACAPYAVNVQIKTEIQARGQRKQAADLPRLVRMLRDANYQGFVTLEYEGAEAAASAVPRHLKELRKLLRAE